MDRQYLIGVDIGTQGTKAALFDVGGKCLATAFRRSRLYQPGGGVVEEDPEFQLTTVCQAIKACVKTAGIATDDVAAIGIDGQMAGIIGVGADGRHATCYDSWLDTRCGSYIKEMERKAGERVVARTGCAPSFNHGPKKLWWMHERKRTFRRIKSFVQPGGYAVMRLCGLTAREAFIDRTYLHFSGFADNRRNRWDGELCKTFKLDEGLLPRIVRSDEIVGELTRAMARRCGLKVGTAVVAGCGDTAASFLACGAVREGVCVDVAGTASVFAATTTAFRADKKHRILGCGQAATEGLWHPYAYINGGGMNLEWFRREIGQGGAKKGLSFEALNRRAEALDDEEVCPLFVPHLAGRVCPSQPDLRGAWAGLTWEHGLGHLYRGVLEGVALEYGIYRDVLSGLYPQLTLKEIRITGGGEKSVLWNRIKSAVLRIPVVQIADSQGGPMGAAMVAGLGAGVFKSLGQAARLWVKKGTRYSARAKARAFYEGRSKAYQRLLDCLNEAGV